MNRRRFLASIGVGGVAGLAGCPGGSDPEGRDSATDSATSDGAASTAVPPATGNRTEPTGTASAVDRPPFRVGTEGFERRTDDGYESLVVRGVNLGMAKPGAFPGEAAITREEYDRWVRDIGAIANVVRTYTIHPPAFYRALASYNESADDPLLLLQGTWVTTADLLDAGDARDLSPTVDRELRRTVDVLHGATTLPDRPGHASGTYDADVSDATLGLLFGIEWPPDAVLATETAREPGAFEGRYLRGDDTTPFERWLGGRLDSAIAHESETYGTQRPAAFVNWVTTDPLDHPYEPFETEDEVSIDPDALTATAAYPAGTFAAYHVYPYYPDLLNETPAYVDYVDHWGEPNSYAGYLNDLVGATTHPLVVAEFGVPERPAASPSAGKTSGSSGPGTWTPGRSPVGARSGRTSRRRNSGSDCWRSNRPTASRSTVRPPTGATRRRSRHPVPVPPPFGRWRPSGSRTITRGWPCAWRSSRTVRRWTGTRPARS